MFNYRVNYLTPEEIYLEVRRFCRDKHSVEELLQHCHDTLGKMLVNNEATYFYKPHNLSALWETIAYEYANYARDMDISSLDADIKAQNLSISLDKHIVKKIPLFFGIEYTGENENLKSGWGTQYNSEDMMDQHRKLYDILFDYCYPEGRPKAYEKDNNNNNLGNLAKPSIFSV